MPLRLGPLRVIRPTATTEPSGTVFFFHGSGSTGDEVCDGIAYVMRKTFSFPHLKVVFPTAPLQPYTPLDGDKSNVWFDRISISSSVPEKIDSIEDIGKSIKQLIKDENDKGIPSSRIIVGGISMGGALAFYTGLNWDTSLGGVFALSSFLNNGSFVYKHLEKMKPKTPELLQFHGLQDDLVPLKAAKDTFDKLSTLGVTGEFLVDEKGEHMPGGKQLQAVYSWINEKLPPL